MVGMRSLNAEMKGIEKISTQNVHQMGKRFVQLEQCELTSKGLLHHWNDALPSGEALVLFFFFFTRS